MHAPFVESRFAATQIVSSEQMPTRSSQRAGELCGGLSLARAKPGTADKTGWSIEDTQCFTELPKVHECYLELLVQVKVQC